MLIRLRVKNLYSFKDAEFSMIASSSERIHAHHIYPARNRNDVRLTRLAAIYGANAAGKSNLVKALEFAQRLVLRSLPPEEKIPVQRFLLDPECAKKRPARFVIEIKHQGRLYEYGFECDQDRIYREWLYTFTRKTQRLLFERRTDPNNNTEVKLKHTTSLPTKDPEFLEFVARGTRPNQLYLRECIERNVKTFAAPYNWFRNTLPILNPTSYPQYLELGIQGDEAYRDFFNEILRASDTGISKLKTTEVNWDTQEGQLVKEMLREIPHAQAAPLIHLWVPSGVRFTILNGEEQPTLLKLVTTHRNSENEEVPFEIHQESEGAQRVLDLIPMMHELMFTEERVFVVDEVGRSLHPDLSRFLVELHLDPAYQNQASQLITTTHETNLLDLDLLRRDEIWFVEKQPDGATDIYSMHDFKRKLPHDKEINKAYLLGRYGGIPRIVGPEIPQSQKTQAHKPLT